MAETNLNESNETVTIEGKELLANYKNEVVTHMWLLQVRKLIMVQHHVNMLPLQCIHIHVAMFALGLDFQKGLLSILAMPNGTAKNTFVVEDMGDVYCTRDITYNWFDIYFGVSNTSNYNNAVNFGKQPISYSSY
ncbi:hypothetical protein A9485_04460 [Bacillus cereus]|nr:hypothetical protein [Bacillus cereus]OJD94746.1 hypothetical protein A9485_04460 [Bacillus cereus]